MRRLISVLRSLVAIASTGVLGILLMAPAATAAEPSLAADLDGDGVHDHVTLDGREPLLVRVWLSGTGTTSLIRSTTPVVRFAATDLDGDQRPELIARGNAAGLQVWSHRQHGFHSYRPRRTMPFALARPTRHSIDDRQAEPLSAAFVRGVSSLALALSPQARAPAAVAPLSAAAATFLPQFLPLDQHAPRPPPALHT